jgi:hypothetical protein
MHYSPSVLNNSELDDQKSSDGHDDHHHVTVLWDLPVVADATQCMRIFKYFSDVRLQLMFSDHNDKGSGICGNWTAI